MTRPPERLRIVPVRATALVLVIVVSVVAVAAIERDGWQAFAAALAGFLVAVAGPAVVSRGGLRPAGYVAPSNLPPPPTHLTGREAEVAELQAYLEDAVQRRRVANLHGVAGIGKTALAVYTAHRAAPKFKAGELFARFVPETPAGDAIVAVRRRFIAALSPAGTVVPDSPWRQAVMYRRLLRRLGEDNQLLIVLDDVTGAALVRPLLPRTRWCAVVITSRNRLDDLPGKDFDLGRLEPAAALQMLAAIVGNARIVAEQGAARQLVRAAAYHPLAIQLVGMALANRPNSRLDVALGRMARGGGGREGTFDNALDLAYSMLTSGEQDALVALGLLDRRNFAHWELAALLGEVVLDGEAFEYSLRLTGVGLLERHSVDAVGVQEFRLLEHVERYARRRAGDRYDDTERAAATARLDAAREGRSTQQVDLADVFETEQQTLDKGNISRAFKNTRDAVALARDCGDREAAAEATAMLAELHAELGGLEDVRDLLASLPVEYPLPHVRALRIRAKLHRRQRQLDDARRLLAAASDLCRATPNPSEEIRLLRERAIVESLGAHPAAGLPLIREARDRAEAEAGQGRQLPALAYAESRVLIALDQLDEAEWVLRHGAQDAEQQQQELSRSWIGYEQAQVARHRGQHEQVLELALDALNRFGGMRHRYGSAHCREIIGRVLAVDDPDSAVRFLAEALETFHNCGDAWVEATAAERLGEVQAERGYIAEAVDLWRAAEQLYESIERSAASARARERLTRVRQHLAAHHTAVLGGGT
ncbi:AAA family ATPase [Dactylosporangium siamense]|uniref:AAA family ATPase n=1 Tax=Dactylosporangium siamense TaxID=685454 RepID=UPI00360953E6